MALSGIATELAPGSWPVTILPGAQERNEPAPDSLLGHEGGALALQHCH